MRTRIILSVLAVAALLGCGGSNRATARTATPLATRGCNGSASVGDFLSITLDPVGHTRAYSNKSNGDSGTVPYTVNADGTYALNDPTGNLVAAYEVPNYALLIQAAKTGPGHNMPALITAVQSSPISIATWAGHSFNYMQFRTAAGGLEVGSANLDALGNIGISTDWPYAAMNHNPP